MGNNLTIPAQIIDVHMHCFAGPGDAAVVAGQIAKLRRGGVGKIVVVGLVNTHLDARSMWNLIPDFVDHRGDPTFHEAADLLQFTRASDSFIIPFVDTRHLWGDVTTALDGYLARGFKGIKGIYLPDEGNDIGVRGVPETFGITLKQYREREWEIFSFAQDHDLPVLYHMDSRQYSEVMVAILQDFPALRINFPHLGIGRSTLAPLLDRYPHLFTDLANLLPHMKNNPASYRDFIQHYPDQVCFGSDLFLYQAEAVLDYKAAVLDLGLPEQIEAQVFSRNPARFLGSALHDSAG